MEKLCSLSLSCLCSKRNETTLKTLFSLFVVCEGDLASSRGKGSLVRERRGDQDCHFFLRARGEDFFLSLSLFEHTLFLSTSAKGKRSTAGHRRILASQFSPRSAALETNSPPTMARKQYGFLASRSWKVRRPCSCGEGEREMNN